MKMGYIDYCIGICHCNMCQRTITKGIDSGIAEFCTICGGMVEGTYRSRAKDGYLTLRPDFRPTEHSVVRLGD